MRVVTMSRDQAAHRFPRPFESGILKMLVIGLGKRDGAAQHHRWGIRGLRDMLPESAKVDLEKTPFVAGLAVLENAREQTARLQVVERDEVLAVEPGLLDEARRSWAGCRSISSTCSSSARSARTTPAPASTRTSSAGC